MRLRKELIALLAALVLAQSTPLCQAAEVNDAAAENVEATEVNTGTAESTADTPNAAEEFTVEFDANEGSGTLPQNMTVTAGQSIVIPAATLTASQKFAGWSADAQAAIPEYLPGEEIQVDGNLKLYAIYLDEFYQITYQVEGKIYKEAVLPGGNPTQVPTLPSGFTWTDENGETVDPATAIIQRDYTFIAAQTQTTPTTPTTPTKSGAPKLISGENHEKFMSGYSNGLFNPETSMTRAQAAKILYGLIENPSSERYEFSDIKGDEWYAEPASALGGMGIIAPDENNAFNGGDPITRAEFAAMLSHFVPTANPQNATEFPDVPADHWAAAAIRDTVAAGLFSGNSQGNFNPNDPMKRAHAATVFNRLLGRTPDHDTITHSQNILIFPDVPNTYWAYDAIMEASTTHTQSPTESGGEQWTSINISTTDLDDGYYSIDGWLYRVVEHRFIYSQTFGGRTFDANGRYTTGNTDLDTYLAKIIRTKTNSSMTRDQKLRALFNYVRDNYSYLSRPHISKGQTGWEAGYALQFFQKGKGNCFSFASAYYELVTALGINCKAIIGTVGQRHSPHSWVEVYVDNRTWLYDTELEMAYRAKGDYRFNLCRFTYSSAPFLYLK